MSTCPGNGDEGRIAAQGLGALDAAQVGAGVQVAAISLWEVAVLESRGRLRLATDCLTWIRAALEAPGLRLLPLTPEIAVGSALLPGSFHGDPADRMLVATARIHGLTLVTKDERIPTYGAAGYVSVMRG